MNDYCRIFKIQYGEKMFVANIETISDNLTKIDFISKKDKDCKLKSLKTDFTTATEIINKHKNSDEVWGVVVNVGVTNESVEYVMDKYCNILVKRN